MGIILDKIKKSTHSKIKEKRAFKSKVSLGNGFKFLTKEEVEADRSKAYQYVC